MTAKGARCVGAGRRRARLLVVTFTAALIGGALQTAAVADDDESADAAESEATEDDALVGATRSFKRRFYVALGVGATRLEPESPSAALTVSENMSTGVELGLGYDLTRWLSGELHVADLGAAEIDFLGTDVGDVDYQVYGVSALLYLLSPRDGFVPFTSSRSGAHRREGLSLFGRFGIGGMSNDSDLVSYERDHTAHAVFGVGLEYGFRNGFALRGELQGFDTDARYAGVSVLKRFGSAERAAPAAVPAVSPPVVESPPAPAVAPPSEPKSLAPSELPVAYFAFDRSDLGDAARPVLDEFAETVRDDERRIVVEGHTDWIGPELYNEGLSERRALAVRDYLVSRGIAPERITTRGYGETRPVNTSRSEEGRALNRRAEVRLD